MQKYENRTDVKVTTNGKDEIYTIVDSYVNNVATKSKKAGVIYLLRTQQRRGFHYMEKHHDQVVLV
jgi:hypothetical protein